MGYMEKKTGTVAVIAWQNRTIFEEMVKIVSDKHAFNDIKGIGFAGVSCFIWLL